jgi:hypothetical protein
LEKNYRLYHTNRSRTKNTAKQIHKALIDRGIQSKIIGDIGRPDKYELESLRKYFSLEREQGSENPVRAFFYHWIGGKISSESVISVTDFGRWMSELCLNNLRSAEDDQVDVYVSHEIWVAAFIYSWLGYNPVNWRARLFLFDRLGFSIGRIPVLFFLCFCEPVPRERGLKSAGSLASPSL